MAAELGISSPAAFKICPIHRCSSRRWRATRTWSSSVSEFVWGCSRLECRVAYGAIARSAHRRDRWRAFDGRIGVERSFLVLDELMTPSNHAGSYSFV